MDKDKVKAKIDEIKEKAPDVYEALVQIKKRFGSFVIKKLEFNDK